MGADGHGPKPYTQRKAQTLFLRVPYSEWTTVTTGRKTEFRASPRSCSQFWDVEPPLPVVAYSIFPSRGFKRTLMVLEDSWREALEAISEESLRREGQPDIAHFRRYWMVREKTAYKPTRMVTVFRVRPWQGASDEARMGERLFERLYGEYRG